MTVSDCSAGVVGSVVLACATSCSTPISISSRWRIRCFRDRHAGCTCDRGDCHGCTGCWWARVASPSVRRPSYSVLVGEWCVENQWALHSQNRSAAYRQVSRLQRAAWGVSAGQIYWSYQLARSAKPGSGEGKPPRDPRNGGNLEAWDLTRVWRHGWIRADTSHDDVP